MIRLCAAYQTSADPHPDATALAVMTGVFVIVTAGSVLGSHIFVLWRYPQYYEKVKDLFILLNDAC